MKIALVGLGKIGLPLAVQYATKGHQVIGSDINEKTVRLVRKGQSPFSGEQGLQEMLETSVAAGLLEATTSTWDAVRQSNFVVVAVPVFVDGDSQPILTAMDDALASRAFWRC